MNIILLTSCRCSRWNWSPISWSFWPMQASTLRATGCWWGSCSIPFCSPSLSCPLASWSPTSSKCAGKCNRKPALPVEGQGWGLLFRQQPYINLSTAMTPDKVFLRWYNRYKEPPSIAERVIDQSDCLAFTTTFSAVCFFVIKQGESFKCFISHSHTTNSHDTDLRSVSCYGATLEWLLVYCANVTLLSLIISSLCSCCLRR